MAKDGRVRSMILLDMGDLVFFFLDLCDLLFFGLECVSLNCTVFI